MQTTSHATTQASRISTTKPSQTLPLEEESGSEPLKGAPTRFRPVPIRGEPLSETIIRDRGRL